MRRILNITPDMHANRMNDVVLVGGGHSHIQVLEAFAAEPLPSARVTVLVDTPIAVYSGMVPGFVAGQYTAEELEIDVAPLARRAHARLIIGRAVRVDAAERTVTLADHSVVSYDVASFDIGSIVIGLDLPGVREHAFATRPIDAFVRSIDSLVNDARRRKSDEPFRVVVIGGGAGGVELAFTLQQRLARDSASEVQVMLIDNGDRILKRFPDSLVRRVERLCRARGIEIRCNRKVTAARADGITFADGEEIACNALIWVTGSICQPIFRESGLATDQRGCMRVRSTLQSEQHDDLFATGDCATLIEHPDTPKAGVYAVRQGPYVAHNLRAWLSGTPLEPYTPQSDFLMLLNTGDGGALGAKWGWSFGGVWVMRLKDRIDRRFMRRFQVEGTEARGHGGRSG
jgi:pyridine nucleotide-disulfide oxidoreductase family protein